VPTIDLILKLIIVFKILFSKKSSLQSTYTWVIEPTSWKYCSVSNSPKWDSPVELVSHRKVSKTQIGHYSYQIWQINPTKCRAGIPKQFATTLLIDWFRVQFDHKVYRTKLVLAEDLQLNTTVYNSKFTW